ncbi:Uncharacterised protein [Mycobacteroides abscessus subsp. abscessus]|nr:Uncharacterised protein [Mycobacteroides abscessus subsp. abscessus]
MMVPPISRSSSRRATKAVTAEGDTARPRSSTTKHRSAPAIPFPASTATRNGRAPLSCTSDRRKSPYSASTSRSVTVPTGPS